MTRLGCTACQEVASDDVKVCPSSCAPKPWKNQKGSPFCNGTTLVDGPSSAATDGALSAI